MVFNTVNLHTYHYAGNNPVKYVDPDGALQKDPDGFVVFDDKADTIHDAWEHGGYSSWQEAANTLGISKFYDSNGNWLGNIPEGQALRGAVLLPTKKTRDAYLRENYPKIIEAEGYSKIAQGPQKNTDIFSAVLSEIFGEVLDRLKSGLGFFFSIFTTTPNSLGSTGLQKLSRDANENKGAMSNFLKTEISMPNDFRYNFSTRERFRSSTSASIHFRNKPYIDD
jgi:hypothetical protein